MQQLTIGVLTPSATAVSVGVTPLSLKVVMSRYILSLAVSGPIRGWMVERYGTRRLFMLAVLTMVSSAAQWALRPDDGESVSKGNAASS